MPDISVIHIALATIMALIGVVVGWIVRSKRCAQEKVAINAGWQEQFQAQGLEHDRLVEQSKGLMHHVSHYQASSKDATNRAKELAVGLKDAFERRDVLQREAKDVRSNLDSVIAERHRLKNELTKQTEQGESLKSALKEKDDKIFALSRQLKSWQERLPPLIQRFRMRNDEAQKLEIELAEAREKVHGLESLMGSDETRVEPVNPDTLSDGLDASNDPLDSNTYATGCEYGTADGDDLSHDLGNEPHRDLGNEPHRDLGNEPHRDLGNEPRSEFGNGTSDTGVSVGGNDHSIIDRPVELRDDLKQIKGVGPAIERTLNELGIFRLSQIAELSEYEIDRVASHLKGFRSRIYREDWIGQARILQYR